MPISLPAQSRRSFLLGATASLATVRLSEVATGEERRDPNRVALLADTHIPARPETQHGALNMSSSLAHAVEEIARSKTMPSRAIFAGDLSYLHGLRQDYELFKRLTEPLHQAGIARDLALGNHDDRSAFYAVMVPAGSHRPAIDRYVGVIELPEANLFLLDTLEATDEVPGIVPPQELDWLDKQLSLRNAKPAIVIGHHNLDFSAPTPDRPPFGLRNSVAFNELLSSHGNVKCYVHGHTHQFQIMGPNAQSRFSVLNLPPTAYTFEASAPRGWVEMSVRAGGAELRLQCLDKGHLKNGFTHDFRWH